MRQTAVTPVLAQLLVARGVTADCAEDYLNPTLKRLLPEPRTLKDIDRAVARVQAAIERREPMAVFGDYDVDGSCAAALMLEFLSAIGQPSRLYIPDRLREGYGPNTQALLALKASGAGLVITVDCGAGAHGPLADARAAGLDVIVLDHHAAPAPIPAFAHVNPNQGGDGSGLTHLCAAAVAFLFAVALSRSLRESGWYAANAIAEPDLRQALDLVGLATVCDVVPLRGVNRAFVRAGAARLSSLARPGIRALAAVAKIESPFTSYHCGFVFGPRINAGGRVGCSTLGAELLMARESEHADRAAQRLDLHNRERQAIEATILEEAAAGAEQQDNMPFLLVAGDQWHPGVAGIVAARLKDRFKKPSFVVGFEDEIGKGSARSVIGTDIGAILRSALEAGILDSGGGHAMAAGFALRRTNLEALRDFLAARFMASAAPAKDPLLRVDALVSPAGATVGLVDELARAGPFGAGNVEPVLAACHVRVAFADVVGRGHVRLRLEGADGANLSAIAFRASGTPLGEALLKARGERIHAAGSLRAELWNGRRQVQLQIEDAASA
ncbi:MAG TPA: single-stranded-DNA-specific exonuclease RecJ [Rhizomicrobium sp.]|jgi:single-stranded-DNA-specific exonuclease